MIGEGTALLESVAVIGAGAWGTTLAVMLAERYRRVGLWVYEADLAAAMGQTRENAVYLPGVPIPPAVQQTASLESALEGQGLVIFVVPSHEFRSVLDRARPFLDHAALVVARTRPSASKVRPAIPGPTAWIRGRATSRSSAANDPTCSATMRTV